MKYRSGGISSGPQLSCVGCVGGAPNREALISFVCCQSNNGFVSFGSPFQFVAAKPWCCAMPFRYTTPLRM